jgi:Mn2+/Fe2+ NRAMP family transporter
MPHNIYLHSALVQSRKEFSTTVACKKEAILYFNIESALSLLVRT